jgi:hypothetical protein
MLTSAAGSPKDCGDCPAVSAKCGFNWLFYRSIDASHSEHMACWRQSLRVYSIISMFSQCRPYKVLQGAWDEIWKSSLFRDSHGECARAFEFGGGCSTAGTKGHSRLFLSARPVPSKSNAPCVVVEKPWGFYCSLPTWVGSRCVSMMAGSPSGNCKNRMAVKGHIGTPFDTSFTADWSFSA